MNSEPESVSEPTRPDQVRMLPRLAASLALVLLTALAVEGILSLTTGRSLLRRAPAVLEADLGFFRALGGNAADADLATAAADNPGPYWLHPDPRVAMVLRPDASVYIARHHLETNHLGLRSRRPAEERGETLDTEAEAARLRIAVVGASIPFGMGVANDETMASQLERLLGPSVAVWTVAIPRWNHRNATRFLLDHWSELQPDIVLYMPFANDLGDSSIPSAAGFRRDWPDPSSPRPWVPVDRPQDRQQWKRLSWAIQRGQIPLAQRDLGPIASESDLAPESARRYNENAESIALLARHAEQRGGRLALLHFNHSPHGWHLLRRVQERGLELPVIPLFDRLEPSFRLGWDPHPNALSQHVAALWIAGELASMGWVEADRPALAAQVPEAYRTRRAGRLSREVIRQRSESARQRAQQLLQSEIDFSSGRGLKQVYGGLAPGGRAGTGLLAMLAPGKRLTVRLAGLADVDLGSIEVEVLVDGTLLGHVELVGEQVGEASFELPATARKRGAVDVQLQPSTWGVERREEILQVVSFRPLLLRMEEVVRR